MSARLARPLQTMGREISTSQSKSIIHANKHLIQALRNALIKGGNQAGW